jgi:aspartyl-tRNA(Asn)/glutamyl-tRNA(Gln) amidotransferase subunit A
LENLAFASIDRLHAMFTSGVASPVDLLEAQLARIDLWNERINAFTIVCREAALMAARASQSRWRAGRPLGRLDGITFTAKDNYQVRGLPYRRGSLATDDSPATESSPWIERMLDAGAVLVGLTTMPEFGAGAVTVSPLTGTTRNPWDVRLHSGGSSGGAAASVAAGFCTTALGSDAGGSVRIPAALTGTVGFKPTGGRIPMYPTSFVGPISSVGPIARSVDDAVLTLAPAIAQDPRDPFASGLAGDWLHENPDLPRLRVAWSIDMGYAPMVDEEVAACVNSAAQRFADLGCVVEQAHPAVRSPLEAFATITRASYRHAFKTFSEEARARLGPVLRAMLEDQAEVSLEAYLDAQDQAQAWARTLREFHRDYDLLILPTVAAPAFDASLPVPPAFAGLSNPRTWSPFTSLFNLTRQPALSVPAGRTAAGLPIGMQLVGAQFNDGMVLAAGRAWERLSGYTPQVPFD